MRKKIWENLFAFPLQKRKRNKISRFSFVIVSVRMVNGGVSKRGASRSGLVLPFFVLFGTFPIFLGFSRFARGWSGDFSRLVLFLFLGLLRAPTRNSPERVRDTIWTFPEKSGKHPGLETLVTRIAATSKSQIASDCNRNSKKSLRLQKHPLKPTFWTREPPVLCGFYSVSEAPHGSANPPEYVATTRV